MNTNPVPPIPSYFDHNIYTLMALSGVDREVIKLTRAWIEYAETVTAKSYLCVSPDQMCQYLNGEVIPSPKVDSRVSDALRTLCGSRFIVLF